MAESHEKEKATLRKLHELTVDLDSAQRRAASEIANAKQTTRRIQAQRKRVSSPQPPVPKEPTTKKPTKKKPTKNKR